MSFSLPEPVSAVAASDKKAPSKEVSVVEAEPRKELSDSIKAQAQSTSASIVASLENMEKTTVMNKIANLRKEIKNDEKYMDNTKKYREEVKRKSPMRNNKNASIKVPITSEGNDKDLEIISDDESPSENNLRLRKPDKRGIMSRNPGSGENRKGRESKIPDRVLYMDKESGNKEKELDRQPRGREDARDDRRGAREDARSDKRGREESREEKRGAREEPRDERRGSGRRRSRSRSRDRGGGGANRRGRSVSKERARPRSVSPYVVAMESWNKFKKAEKEMLDRISKRRDAFEKRPEDHPKYAEEWKNFWEKRYKELQSQGRDPNNHDFKAEWIPYWTKHVSDLFDSEVLDKTNDLLRKHNLKSVAEPKREDYPSRSQKRQRSRSRERRRSPDRRRSPGRAIRRSRSRSRGRRNAHTQPQIWEDQGSNQFPLRPWNDGNYSQGPPVDWQQQEMLARDLDRSGHNNDFSNNQCQFGGNRDYHMPGTKQDPFGNEVSRNRNLLNENCFERNDQMFGRDRGNFDRNFESDTVDRNEGRRSRFQDDEERPSRFTRSDGQPSRFDAPNMGDQFRPSQAPPQTQVANFGRNPDIAPQNPIFGQFGKRPEEGRGPGSLFPIARAPAADVSEVRQESNDVYSGLSELEDKRDRGRSRTPSARLDKQAAQTETSEPVHVVQCLRVLSALEDSLGSLGPSVNRILGKALSIEQSREGASKVLLEDPDTVSILEMVKEKLSGLVGAGLLEGSRVGAVKVCLSHLNKLLSVATKKRSENISSLIQESPVKLALDSCDKEEEARAQTLIAETLASSLIQAGEGDISDQDLERIVEELMRMTAQDDPESSLGRYARSFLQTSAVEKQIEITSANNPQRFQNVKREKDIQVVTLDDNLKDSSDALEELTVEDLKSLLRSFNTLSKQEQNDLINYMKKLEATDPEKVKILKEVMKTSDQDQGGLASRKRSDWSPSPFNKRPRRLSGSDLEMNPVNPEPQQAEPKQDSEAGKWRTVEPGEPPSRSKYAASFGAPGQQGRGSGWRGRGQEEADMDQIPLNPLYTSRQGQGSWAPGESHQGMNQMNPMNPMMMNNMMNTSNPMNPMNPMFLRQGQGFQNNRNQNYDNW